MANRAFEEHELSSFLRGKRCGSGAEASMTGMGDTKGKWYISDTDYPQFLNLLYDYLFVKRGRPMAFVEQPRKGMSKPLLVDLDFKYSAETSLVRAFTLDQIRSFCRLLVDGLNIFFGVQDFEELRFFITLRPGPYSSKSDRKDGIHIMCPDIGLVDEKQKVIRDWILSQNGVANCFAETNYINKDEDVYDESMTHKQGWIFYGESKPNIQPYALSAIFSYSPREDLWSEQTKDGFSNRQLMELLSVRYNIPDDDNAIREDARDLYRSFANPPALTFTPQRAENAVLDNPLVQVIVQTNAANHSVSEEERGIIGKFVMNCLSHERADNYDLWKRVGWCLHNIDTSEDMFKLYMDFSAKSTKSSGNNIADLRREWFAGMRKSGDGPRLTERSLRKWARDDNPEEYKKIMAEYIGEYIRESIEPTHHHIALLMKRMYGSTYIASVTPRDTDWFKYDEAMNMWKRLNQGIELRLKISHEVAKSISDAKGKLWADMERINERQREISLEKCKDLLNVEMNLYKSGFVDSVMKMAVNQFYEEDFENKLNVDPALFGCRNGILELRAPGTDGRSHVIFRQGRPEDYVSFLAGQSFKGMAEPINYVPYDAADPRQAEIADFFTKLFPNVDLRRYVLRLLASCLEGENREQCFYIATGVGGNGKSKLIDLMRMTLGEYQTSLQTTVLTRKRPESGAANPDMIVAKRKRFIYLQEPDEKEPLNTSRMKQFSGEDIVEARGLYKEQDKFTITGKLIMMCNKLPPVNAMDRGTWRRIRVIEFISKFLPPKEYEDAIRQKKTNVFPQDTMLDKKLESWREPFLALLVKIFEEEYIPFGLNPVPAAVMAASEKYKKDHDVFANFMSERVRRPITNEEKMECQEHPVALGRIRLVLSAWKKEVKCDISPQDVINRLVEEFGEPDSRGWDCFILFESADQARDWDEEHLPAAP